MRNMDFRTIEDFKREIEKAGMPIRTLSRLKDGDYFCRSNPIKNSNGDESEFNTFGTTMYEALVNCLFLINEHLLK